MSRRLNIFDVATRMSIAVSTLRTRLEAKANGNRWKLRRASLADTPPMQKKAGRWVIYEPHFEEWLGGQR